MTTTRRADAAVAWGLPLVLSIVPWIGMYPPMGDLPLHESIAALLVHRNDPAWAPPGLYVASLGHPQQLVQLVMAAAMLVLPTAAAAKLAVSLSLAGIAGGTVRLLRHLGRTPWAAALVAPLAFGWLYNWGFVANLAGLAVFAMLAVDVDRLAEAPTSRRAAGVAGWIALAFLAHAVAALSAVVMLGVMVALRRRRIAVALSPALVFAIATLVERKREHVTPTILATGFAERIHWHAPFTKLVELPTFIAGRYDLPIQLAVIALLVGAFVALALRARSERADARTLVDRRFAIVAGVLLVLFLVGPYSVNYGAFLYARFLGTAWICLVAAAAPTHTSLATKAVPVACLVAALFALAPEIQRADQHNRQLAALYPRIAMGSAVAVVAFGKGHRSAFHPTTAGHRVLAERGGRELLSFAEYPTSPLTIAPEKRWDALTLRVYTAAFELRPSSDLDVVRYVLAWVPDETLWPLLDAAFRPDARLVAREGEWLLFESTHAVRPVDAPPPAVDVAGASIQARVKAILYPQRAP